MGTEVRAGDGKQAITAHPGASLRMLVAGVRGEESFGKISTCGMLRACVGSWHLGTEAERSPRPTVRAAIASFA